MEVSWEQKPVLPGETGYIKVVHDAGRKGVFSKMLAVFTNENSRKFFFLIRDGFIETCCFKEFSFLFSFRIVLLCARNCLIRKDNYYECSTFIYTDKKIP